jgi:hypothetical protein
MGIIYAPVKAESIGRTISVDSTSFRAMNPPRLFPRPTLAGITLNIKMGSGRIKKKQAQSNNSAALKEIADRLNNFHLLALLEVIIKRQTQ